MEEKEESKKKEIIWLDKGDTPITPGLFKELAFFKNEIVFMVIVSFVSIFLIFGELLEILPGATFKAFLLMFGFTWVMWLIKWMLYLPRGKKIIIEKAFEDGSIQLIVANPPKDNAIHYSKNDLEIPATRIEKYNKHREFYTGKPLVKTIQGHSTNYSIHELASDKMDKSGQEVESLIEKSYDTGWLTGLNIALKMQEKLKNPIFMLSLIVLIAIAFLVILSFIELSTLSSIAERLPVVAGGE